MQQNDMTPQDSEKALPKIEQLRLAAAIGLADIKAGRFVEFSDGETLSAYLNTIADKAILG